MRISVKLQDQMEVMDLPDESKAFAAIKAMGLFPDAVLVMRDGQLLPEDESIGDGDSLEIIKVVSGG